MGAMKELMMDAGERNCILANANEVRRWAAATGLGMVFMPICLESRGRAVWCDSLAANDARRLANDPRVAESDREELLFRLEVGGLPTDLPDWSYSWGDRWSELVDRLFYGWWAQLATSPRATGRIAGAANVLRSVGLRAAADAAATAVEDAVAAIASDNDD